MCFILMSSSRHRWYLSCKCVRRSWFLMWGEPLNLLSLPQKSLIVVARVIITGSLSCFKLESHGTVEVFGAYLPWLSGSSYLSLSFEIEILSAEVLLSWEHHCNLSSLPWGNLFQTNSLKWEPGIVKIHPSPTHPWMHEGHTSWGGSVDYGMV